MKQENLILLEQYKSFIETIDKPLKLKEVASILKCSDRVLINCLRSLGESHLDIMNKKFPNFCKECSKPIDFNREYCGKSCQVTGINSKIFKYDFELFKKEIQKISPFIFPLESYKGNTIKIKCICNRCNIEFISSPISLFKGIGCIYCSNKYTGGSYTLEQFSIFIQRNSPQWELLDTEYIPNEKSKIKCKNCGDIRVAIKQKLRLGQVNCQVCESGRKTTPEKQIENFLIKNNIEYVYQKRFKNLIGKNKQPYRFDFYLSNYNICIEYDGQGHFKTDFYLNKTGVIDYSYDIKKEKYCNDNNIKLLRIPYWEQKDMLEYLSLYLDESENFNSVITNNYRGKEYSHLIEVL